VKRARNSEPKRSSKECTFCIRGQQEDRKDKREYKQRFSFSQRETRAIRKHMQVE